MSLTDSFKKLSKLTKIIIAAAAVAVIAAAVICIVIARSGYTATTMRLLRVEGAVSLEDSKGTTKPVSNNLRFQSGDALNTGTDGLASVGLDNTKIITLQNDSRAEFKKKNKHLELKLTKGAVFFNVTEKLRSDEKFEIRTSTMTAGIRGTSGMIYYDVADGREALLITDGKVEVSATNPETGETKTAMVEAGQEIKVYLYFDRVEDSVEFSLSAVTEAQLPKFAATRIAEDNALSKRVCDANDWNGDAVKKKAAEPESTTKAAPKSEPTTEATTEATTTTTEATTTTTETTESTTESTTAKPTSTPTPKPKATSTPKPTPTKKPTPKVTETSAESTPESASETTKPTSYGPEMPAGCSKYSNVWGKESGSGNKFICRKGASYLGYDDGGWIELTRKNESSGITRMYKFLRKDGSTYYTDVDAEESLIPPETFSTTTTESTPKSEETTTTTTTKPTTTTTTAKPTSSTPDIPNGYVKVSQGWGTTYNGSTVYVCKLDNHGISGSEYIGYENGKWIDLSYSEQKSGRNKYHMFKKSNNDIYFEYSTNVY